jgi:hypothetical protein
LGKLIGKSSGFRGIIYTWRMWPWIFYVHVTGVGWKWLKKPLNVTRLKYTTWINWYPITDISVGDHSNWMYPLVN